LHSLLSTNLTHLFGFHINFFQLSFYTHLEATSASSLA